MVEDNFGVVFYEAADWESIAFPGLTKKQKGKVFLLDIGLNKSTDVILQGVRHGHDLGQLQTRNPDQMSSASRAYFTKWTNQFHLNKDKNFKLGLTVVEEMSQKIVEYDVLEQALKKTPQGAKVLGTAQLDAEKIYVT